MKIYFDATPTGLSKYSQNYDIIAKTISDLGHQHTSDFITNFSPENFKIFESSKSDHYSKIMQAVKDSDVVVVEVTMSSMSVGMCIQQGLLMGKPVVALHTADRKDIFIQGAEDVESKLLVVEYSISNAVGMVKDSLEYVKDWLDCRFTLIIDNKIRKHLDKISLTGKNRSEYIRELIRKDMGKE